MNLPKNERCPIHTHFSAAVRNSFGYTLIRLAGEGRNKSNSCLSLLARSVPTCPPEVDDAHGLFFVRGLIANMATIPKPVVPACDWCENDSLLTPQQVAESLNTSLDWVWDHSLRKMPLLPVILIEFRRFLDSQVPLAESKGDRRFAALYSAGKVAAR